MTSRTTQDRGRYRGTGNERGPGVEMPVQIGTPVLGLAVGNREPAAAHFIGNDIYAAQRVFGPDLHERTHRNHRRHGGRRAEIVRRIEGGCFELHRIRKHLRQIILLDPFGRFPVRSFDFGRILTCSRPYGACEKQAVENSFHNIELFSFVFQYPAKLPVRLCFRTRYTGEALCVVACRKSPLSSDVGFPVRTPLAEYGPTARRGSRPGGNRSRPAKPPEKRSAVYG